VGSCAGGQRLSMRWRGPGDAREAAACSLGAGLNVPAAGSRTRPRSSCAPAVWSGLPHALGSLSSGGLARWVRQRARGPSPSQSSAPATAVALGSGPRTDTSPRECHGYLRGLAVQCRCWRRGHSLNPQRPDSHGLPLIPAASHGRSPEPVPEMARPRWAISGLGRDRRGAPARVRGAPGVRGGAPPGPSPAPRQAAGADP